MKLNLNKKITVFIKKLRNYLGKAFANVCVTDTTPACVCLSKILSLLEFHIPKES